MRRMLAAVAVLATLILVPHRALAAGERHAVYVNLADSLQGSLDDATAALRAGFVAEGWQVVAVHDVAADRATCPYRARVFVLHSPRYAEQVLAHGPRAAFAVPIRVALYQDEAGLHLAAVDPLSIDRTIVAETGFEAASRALLDDLQRIAGGVLRGRFALREYGQVRDRGLIGRTMGIMAGGPFLEKIKDVHTAPGDSTTALARVAEQVWRGIEQGAARGRWQIRGIYRLDLSAQGVIVIGVSGEALEAKSFAIVGAGNDERRSHYQCAGLAHAAAYPIEIVVFRDQGQVHVGVLDGMYRMKMYFEDAGKMKFAANMGMPGSVEDEIRGLILAGVGAKH
jgi:uncharacterized protein (DUF302 family)